MLVSSHVSGWFVDQANRAADPHGFDKGKLMAAIAVRARQGFAANFAAGGRPAWAALAPSTLKQKMAMYLAGRILGRKVGGVLVNRRSAQPQAPGALFTLIRSGDLRNSVARRGVKGNITRINPAEGRLELGTNIPYGAFHQEGTSKMPARPFLELDEKDWDDIYEMVADYLYPIFDALTGASLNVLDPG